MCLLEVAMCETCRSSHFQSDGGGWGMLGRDNSPLVNNVEYIIILILLSQSMNLYTRMAHPITLQNITLTVLTSFFVSTFLKEIQIIFI